MKKALICLSLSIAILIVFSIAWLYSNRSRAVIYSFSPDPDMVRPRNYCLLNPFRDKSPEIIAEKHLDACAGAMSNQFALSSIMIRMIRNKSIIFWIMKRNGQFDPGGSANARIGRVKLN